MKDLYSFQQKAWSHHSDIIVPLIAWKKLCIATAETDHPEGESESLEGCLQFTSSTGRRICVI